MLLNSPVNCPVSALLYRMHTDSLSTNLDERSPFARYVQSHYTTPLHKADCILEVEITRGPGHSIQRIATPEHGRLNALKPNIEAFWVSKCCLSASKTCRARIDGTCGPVVKQPDIGVSH